MPTRRTLLVCNKKGLHARPAAKLVRLTNSFPDTALRIVSVTRKSGASEAVHVVAGSVLGLLMLAAECGTELLFEADGPDAVAVLDAVEVLVAGKFGEEA